MQNLNPPSPGCPSPTFSRQPKRSCNCKNSKCLKLYCECFSQGEYCNNCNCMNCHNTSLNESFRKEAISSILERNPSAFRQKNLALDLSYSLQDRRSKGCACRRTGCLKKYCECYQAGVVCSDLCKCVECKNESHVLRELDLPVKRIIFKSENSSLDPQIIREFFDGVFREYLDKENREENEKVNLMCEEELVSKESCESLESPRKKIFTFSSEFQKIENSIYGQLILAIEKSCEMIR